MVTWQFWVLIVVLYCCVDRVASAIERRKGDGEK